MKTNRLLEKTFTLGTMIMRNPKLKSYVNFCQLVKDKKLLKCFRNSSHQMIILLNHRRKTWTMSPVSSLIMKCLIKSIQTKRCLEMSCLSKNFLILSSLMKKSFRKNRLLKEIVSKQRIYIKFQIQKLLTSTKSSYRNQKELKILTCNTWSYTWLSSESRILTSSTNTLWL